MTFEELIALIHMKDLWVDPAQLAEFNKSLDADKSLLKRKDPYGLTLLHHAAMVEKTIIMDALIKRYGPGLLDEDGVAKVDVVDKMGRTPLYLAIENSRPNAVYKLKNEAGANINYKRAATGFTPRQVAIGLYEKNYLDRRYERDSLSYRVEQVMEIVDKSVLIIKAKNVSDLMEGMEAPHRQKTKIKKGAEEAAIETTITADTAEEAFELERSEEEVKKIKKEEKRKEFFSAVESGNVDEVIDLLSKGALIDQEDELGFRPIHLAARMGSLEMVRLFVEKGALLQPVRPIGEECPPSPIFLAAQMVGVNEGGVRERKKIVKLLAYNAVDTLIGFIAEEDREKLIDYIADNVIYMVNRKRGVAGENIDDFIRGTMLKAIEPDKEPGVKPKATGVTTVDGPSHGHVVQAHK